MQNPTDQAETSITAETVMVLNDPNLNRTFTVRRKAAKRSESWYQTTSAPLNRTFTVRRKAAKRSESWYQTTSAPLPLPSRKKPRLEEPLLPPSTTTDEASRKTGSPDMSVGLPPPVFDNANNDSNAESVTDTQPNAGATGRWTPEEDAKLTSAVTNSTYNQTKKGKQNQIDWVAVAVLVLGRTKR
jgi:hypothetical protein